MWPIAQLPDIDTGVREFLKEKLCISDARIAHIMFNSRLINSRPGSNAVVQVLVTFDSARSRDEVKAKASNLRGHDASGCQLKPPDYLRGQYQDFQSLAYCLKKKTPDLRRNIKFDDRERALIMDVKTEEGWKTIEYD